jgi:hypothetical protein
MVKKIGHLDEEQIIEAIVDERGLDGALRRHLFECSACRGQKEALAGRLARFGQVSREHAPVEFRKPRISQQRAGVYEWAWEIHPLLGMGVIFASLLVLLLTPLTLNRDTVYTLDTVYQEMRQDDKFMAEIEKLEDNPLPRIYVDIGDSGDDEKDSQSPGALKDDSMSPDGGPRNA